MLVIMVLLALACVWSIVDCLMHGTSGLYRSRFETALHTREHDPGAFWVGIGVRLLVLFGIGWALVADTLHHFGVSIEFGAGDGQE